MRFAGNLFRFLVFSNLFIAGCAILMVYQTTTFLLHSQPDASLVWFIFSATLCSYSFHWYLTADNSVPVTSREKWLVVNRRAHLVLFIVGLLGSAVFGLMLLKHWYWLLLSAFITFLYSAPKIPHPYFRVLRKVALGKTIFLALVWMYVTTILPLLISDAPWQPDFFIFAASRFFLVYAICIVFDYRDKEYDRSIGIRSLVTWLNEKAIAWLFGLSLLIFLVFTCLLYTGHGLVAVILLLLPGFITAALYQYATRHFSDTLYYFVLDGLMALSALLTLVAGL